jgi:hypothetical protein
MFHTLATVTMADPNGAGHGGRTLRDLADLEIMPAA